MTPNPVISEPIAAEVILANGPLRLLVNRQYLPFLKESGLLQGDALLKLSNHSLVKEHYHHGVCDRIVDRVFLGEQKIKAYRKICKSVSLAGKVKCRLEGAWTVAGRNWRANLKLAAAGIPVAAPIALIERRTGPFARDSALLTAELEGYQPLSRLLRQGYLQNDAQAFGQLKRKISDALVCLLGQLIEAGVVNPTLSSKHIYLTEKESGLDYALIDVGRSRVVKGLEGRDLVNPLCALHRSMPLELLSSADRLRLFRRVFDGQGFCRDQKALIRRIVRKAGQRGFKDINSDEYSG